MMRWLPLLLAASFAAPLTACRERATSEATGHEHDPFHDHDHHTPAHKPANLRAAIATLRERYDRLAELSPESHAAEHEREELVDIVRWLPEIAGDSDMPEEQWNVVDRVSAELLRQSESASSYSTTATREAVIESLDELAALEYVQGDEQSVKQD